jgi:hypothetical protein
MGVRTSTIAFKVTPALKSALEVEAWESGLRLSDYVRGLLERRYKWWRTAGKAGGYDLAAIPPGKK